jgi:type III secretion protein HrpB1
MGETKAAIGCIEELRAQLRLALGRQEVDEAEHLIDELTELDPTAKNDPLPRVFWLLQCGRPLDALHLLNDCGDAAFPELRAVCLKGLGDPTWQGLASSLCETSGPVVRLAMAQLLAVSQ